MAALRSLARADLKAILAIQQASPEAAQWSAEAWESFVRSTESAADEDLRAGYCAWVAERDGKVAGFLAGLFSGVEMEILNLAVSPGERRAGVASRLLEGALAAARSSGGERAFLEVRASNAEAIAFYERNGFLPAGRRKDYYATPVEDALVFAHALAADD
ncbi:MAG: ribosomal protein S18-alanine N-acetyltransferase [Acidobacteria bacterium]|nr:ribosomal protein S18-alanine N-acetyltransferase [Acidobacteriota bacterium]MBI3663745.1 ribosomal protein S18-alanine N-acetyltransferase [Acidobacteriota bacterium]